MDSGHCLKFGNHMQNVQATLLEVKKERDGRPEDEIGIRFGKRYTKGRDNDNKLGKAAGWRDESRVNLEMVNHMEIGMN